MTKNVFKGIGRRVLTTAAAIAAGICLLGPVSPVLAADTSELPSINDTADIYTPSEEASLQAMIDAADKETGTQIYIVTDPDLSMSDDYERYGEAYAERIDASDKVILVIGMRPGDRVYVIQGYGTAQEYLNNTRADKVADHMQSDMRAGNYYAAAHTYIRETQSYLGRNPMLDNFVFKSYFQILICLAIGGIVLVIVISGRGGKMTADRKTYQDESAPGLIGHYDRYVRTTTTRTKRSSSSGGGGGGGGGGHSSSGGHSF